VIREDRELLTELARINREMAPLTLRIMDGSASAAEQQTYAQRLLAVGERLGRRAAAVMVDGEVVASGGLTIPTVPPRYWSCEQR
jgi:hypothetical protein